MLSWKLTDREWQALAGILSPPVRKKHSSAGRPRLENDRQVAQACLYRYLHSHAKRYRAFGWNKLPENLAVSPATANRRFREWNATGAWNRFYEGLTKLRAGGGSARLNPVPVRSPVKGIVAELERAFSFFNAYFFGNELPPQTTITVEQYLRPLGCFSATGDHNAIAISATALGQGCETTLAVLVHEMVHLRNHLVRLPDVHRKYHNRHFRDSAMLAGLEGERRDPIHGYMRTHLSERGLKAVRKFRPNRSLFAWLTEHVHGQPCIQAR